MPQPTVILISGANRGLGKGLLERYLARPNHIIIAANRDPKHSTSVALGDLAKGEGSKLVVVKVDSLIEEDAFDAVKELQTTHGIQYLDMVIANAGISAVWPTVVDVKLQDLANHMAINVYGLISLFQATKVLLKKSPSGKPIFAPMGSTAGLLRYVMLPIGAPPSPLG